MSYDSEKPVINDMEDMENVELHRANSMVNSDIDVPTANPEDTAKKSEKLSKAGSFCSEIGYMKIEVVMYLYMFSYMMRHISSTTMIMEKSCLVHLGYSKEICSNLANYSHINTEVEKLANNYALGHGMITMIPSSILACFVGSWSDKYGRKLPIMISLLGTIIDELGSAVCAAVFYSRVEFYFIPAIFSGFSGGMISALTVIYSYASDTTTFKRRTIKYALIELSFGIAIPLGSLAGGWLYKFFGYTWVFIISSAGHVFALTWVMFAIKETRGLDNKDSWRVKFSSLWSLQQVIDSFKATTKERPNRGREQILWLMGATSLTLLTYLSTGGIAYLYVHHQFNWDNTTFSTISAVIAVFGLIAMFIAVPLFKKLNLGDATLGLVGSISLSAKNIGLGLSTTRGVYFIASLAGVLGGLSTLAGRSRISKVSSKNDIGKIFAFLSTAEAVLPLLSTAAVSQIFNASLDFYPGLIYLIMGILMLMPVGVFLWLSRLPAVDYEEMHNTQDDTESSVKEKSLDLEKY